MAAADALERRYIGTGAFLQRSCGLYRIGPRDGVLGPHERRGLARVRRVRTEIDVDEARALRGVMVGALNDAAKRQNIGRSSRVAIGRLLSNGLIEARTDHTFRLTPTVAYSLGIQRRAPARRDSPSEGATR